MRFISPSYDRNTWNEIDSAIKQLISPIHFRLSNRVITPQEAASKFSEVIYSTLKDKSRIYR